jgi:hypothetical protein
MILGLRENFDTLQRTGVLIMGFVLSSWMVTTVVY